MAACPACGTDNPQGARFCSECGAALDTTPVAPAEETRKIVTILFCDVTGSTELGEQLDPESLRKVMARYFDAMRSMIERHGGTVEKFIGDAVMAVFGIPTLHEDDALRAIRAASGMRSALEDMNDQLDRDFGVRIESRIGVNTGEVLVGADTSDFGRVTGDPVNTAARLEAAAEPGEILMGQDTYRLVRDAIHAAAVEPLRLKGKASPVPAFRLLDVLSGTAPPPRSLRSPMVGRGRELEDLRRAFDRAIQDRTCLLFTVLGAAGAGKSRLTEEFVAQVEGSAHIVTGRCLPYGEGITYWPVAQAVRAVLDVHDFDRPEEVVSRLARTVDGDDHAEAEEAAAVAVGSADGVERALGLGVLAKLQAGRGTAEEAAESIAEAVSLVDRTDFLFDRGTVYLDRARTMHLLDRGDEARLASDEAAKLFDQKGDLISAARARAFPSDEDAG